MGTWVVVNTAAVDFGVQLSKTLPTFLPGVHPEAEFLDPVILLFPFFKHAILQYLVFMSRLCNFRKPVNPQPMARVRHAISWVPQKLVVDPRAT